jgi:ApaG protein
VQLLRRHWIITDGHGHVEHVEGPGVVGETPVLKPGARFRYTSFCPLPTSMGAMEGTFLMRRLDDGSTFDARIVPFSLFDPLSEN